MERNNTARTDKQTHPLRARVILEFVEGDLSRPPVVYPDSNSDEMDSAICAEIERRWSRRGE